VAKLDGIGIGAIAVGAGLLYAGVKGKSVPSLIQGFIQGKSPSAATAAAGANLVPATGTTPTYTGAPSSSIPTPGKYYTQSEVQQLWISNGGASDTAAFAAQVAMAESSGGASVTSPNPDGGTNVGLFQLDTKGVGSGHTVAELQNANTNTQITIMATGNGIHWNEWSDPVVDGLPGATYTPGG